MMVAQNGQGKADVYEYLDRCCQLVSETYGKPNRADWTNGDYIGLSRVLFRQTRVQISPNTLKRIFGKIRTDSRYYPQKATRDALAAYIGYPDWDHFVEDQPNSGFRPEPSASETDQPPVAGPRVVPPPAGTSRPMWPWLAVAALVLLAATLLWQHQPSDLTTDSSLQLVCLNPAGENPHSAQFAIRGLDQPGSESARLMIDFGDGKRRAADAGTGLYNHYYEQPGRYFAVLRQGRRPIDTATVYLPTKGWTATAYMMHDTTRVYPIETTNLFTGGKHSISLLELTRAGIDTNRTFFVEFVNTHVSEIDGDNFEFIARVVSSPMRAGVRCSQAGVTVYGESSKHSFDVMKPGCVYWTQIQLSEQLKQGQQEDLSFLGADLRTGGTLTLRVINRQAHLFINGHQVYQARYTQPLGRVYGVNIKFAGVGTIQSFSLRDLKTGKLFNGSF